ncbi:ORF6N domain-containing protein [Acinetobacter junii]|uniref:ORF6N domain-containing protein n=1 Tax=Acinetobacter junii TaxID=40215 RepID=UPI001FB3944F|nr:ORF6N domain-containing protein [Acinetobacter junii]UOB51267.1 ORF6N domain-containing protein [Acinetobacter junii]
MSSLAQINDTQVSIINFKSVPVLTTEQLSNFYGTESVRIRQNHHENKGRFVEGKHFFKIVGQELKDFVSSLKLLANFPTISNKTRSLILWTERGAARHAKMLDTDQAWEVFEQLEDCYFVRKEILAKTHKSDREPLTNAVNLLVAKTKHLNYSEAYKLVHQRFNVQHIEDIPFHSIPIAVEYIHHLIALFSHKEFRSNDMNTIALAHCMIWCRQWWKEYGDAIRKLNPNIASAVHDYFIDGSFVAWGFVDESEKPTLRKKLDAHKWNLNPKERLSYN